MAFVFCNVRLQRIWLWLVLGFVLNRGFCADTSMEADRPISWWKMGEAVRYRMTGNPPDSGTDSIKGVVTNSSGKEVAAISLAREQWATGWSWTPSETGYYEVEFFAENKEGKKHPLQRSFWFRAPNGATKEFHHSRRGIAVLPNNEFPPTATHQFGFATYSSNPEDLMLAQLVGFNLVRLTAHWGPDGCGMVKDEVIESTKGNYNWVGFDRLVDMYTAAGFQIYAQIYGTPYWASPHPEKAGTINICVDAATAYAPVDMKDWTRFLEVLVQRYNDRIRLWEIGNEPAMPGGSCFWLDTPENYFQMLKSGYETIKKNQPDSEIWIGGLGANSFYHAFYDRILSLGGGSYFDGLSLHGSWNSPQEKFRDIEKRWNAGPKPAFNSEWHAVLQGNMQSGPVLSEEALAFRMMCDLMHQLKQGMTRTILFEIKNLVERETLDFCIQNKWFVHSSGLFRKRPQTEPRLPAVILSNFLITSGRQAAFKKEIALSPHSMAVELTTAQGPLLAFWSEKEPLAADLVKEFTTPQSRLTDWEGRARSFDATEKLEPGKLYYLSQPNIAKLDAASPADKLVSPRQAERQSRPAPTGPLSTAKLFDAVNTSPTVSGEMWITKDWHRVALTRETQNSSLTARAALASTPQGLDVVVEVTDPVHVQKESSAWWSGDSVQIALDCENSGLAGGNTEFVFALTEQGPVAWKILAAEPHGNIPAMWSPSGSAAKFVETHIVRNGEITRYQIRIPWSELYPLIYDAGKPLHAALVINNNDGKGRAECLEWAAGISRSKDPAQYGTLKPITNK
ncbi:MAG: hypothetical protein B9S32_14870 [Verrucomicrobia bacterium Tous-C9LFEB]|nr:MAG: hypothetical protein B9S32_14870 [Verrucomicrobia bacterium Tous-C9LFEB]